MGKWGHHVTGLVSTNGERVGSVIGADSTDKSRGHNVLASCKDQGMACLVQWTTGMRSAECVRPGVDKCISVTPLHSCTW